MATGSSTKVIVIALFANLGIACGKFFGAFVSGSASMLAEAIHSVVDSSNQLLLLWGAKRSKRPATEKYPLGFGREAFFWSFIVAIMLFSLGGLFAIYEGVHKLNEHSGLSYPQVALGILLFSIAVEGYSFWACYQEVRRQNTFGSLWSWFHKTTSSELLVIFTEDLAALTGLVIATLALLLSWITGDSTWDGVGSIAVGALLVVTAVLLAIEVKSLLIGEAAVTDYRPLINAELESVLPGAKVLRIIALQTGASEVLLSYKIHPGDTSDVSTLIKGINVVEKKMRDRCPEIHWQFIEPDFSDD